MKLVLAVLILVAGVLVAKDAHAIAACGNNSGLAPKRGAVLPQRAQLLVFDTDELPEDGYTVRINGKQVPLEVKDLKSGPFYLRILKVGSDATGTLKLYQLSPSGARRATEERELASYTVKKKLKLAEKVSGKAKAFFRELQHSTVEETYDALAIDLGDEQLAIKATVKLRRDAKGTWQTLEVPVVAGDWMDEHTVVRVGKLGCQSNYSAALLRAGVDVEVTVTMADGTTRAVELPARYKLPAAPPARRDSP